MTRTERETISEMSAQLKAMQHRQDREYDELRRRLDGVWWKIGILAGVVSIIVGRVFGGITGEILGALVGM